ADLGFESTRELLEELDDFIKLTVFKGGRIYATVIAQPAWDEALAAPQKKAGTSGKSWKKKRGDKSIKAVKPRRVKREIPEVAKTVEETPVEEAAEDQNEATILDEPIADDAEPQAEEAIHEQEVIEVTKPTEEDALEANETEEVEDASTVEEQEDNDSLPAISLTVIYDPDNANAGVTTIESNPIADASAAEQSSDGQDSDLAPVKDDTPANDSEPAKALEKTPEPTPTAKPVPQPVEPPVPAPTPAPAPAPAPAPEPIDPAAQYPDYPVDFSTEVFCPGDILFELASLLPFGADAMGIAGEYYWIARERGTIDATRNRASFTLRYTQAGKRHEAIVHLRRHPNTPGSTWVIDQIEASEL
ncbi:MAG: hypothetical protein SOR45_01725, partial [Collinsella bouchesdurhonensis]|nr:hypothetical protein [Collinsella bouchesdurhonensis]